MHRPGNEEQGVVFPRTAAGARSSSGVGREVLAAALDAVDPAQAALARSEREWRRRYPGYLKRLVELSVAAADAPLAVARAGLATVATSMRFVRDGAESSIAEAMATPRADGLRTASQAGQGDAAPAPLSIPYRGRLLTGDALRRQLDDWLSRGIVEPSFVQALRRVDDNPGWLDLSDLHVVLLGAAAEMGPLQWFAQRRANLIAVDLAQPPIWQRLFRIAHAGNGTLFFPVRDAGASSRHGDPALRAGADLLTETPEIAAWLGDFDAPPAIGAYAYLDGAQHLRVATAMDAIQAQRCSARRDTTIAMLGTPTDVCAVPAEVMRAAHAAYDRRPQSARLWQQPLRALSGGRLFARNVEPAAGGWGIADALVVQQGPSYALAKRVQQWRALVARADGWYVSSHIAPPSLTGSVLSNRMMAAAYRAAGMFGVEVFEPATASALMAALLVHDLRNPHAAADPATTPAHPLLQLTEAAHHGGLWRMPFAARSALPVAALVGALRRT